MNVSEAIRARRSIRLFRNKGIPEEVLERVLDAGRVAPSARNMQNWLFIVVREKETRARLMAAAKNQTFVGQAPVVIVACGTMCDYVMSCGQPAYTVDVSIALDHMSLQAIEEGLGTCWVCAFSEAEVKDILGIPEDLRVVALLPIGYPAEGPEARPRKEMTEVIHYERFVGDRDVTG